jgi:hypothetical protein
MRALPFLPKLACTPRGSHPVAAKNNPGIDRPTQGRCRRAPAPRHGEAANNFIGRSRSMQVVEILSVRVLHTLAQKLGAGVSFSLQGKPEVAADHPAAGPHGADRNL